MKSLGVLALTLFAVTTFSDPSFAQEVNDIAKNITTSSEKLPGLVSALSYLLALVLAVSGLFKLKDHVENPAQNPLRNAIIRLLVAGALLALPIIYEAMATAINGGTLTKFDPKNGIVGTFLTILAGTANLPILNMLTMDFNSIMNSILDSISDVPGMITALGYALGLVLGVSGLLKLKEHVESPEQNPLREGVIRLLVGGALFALPTVYQAMAETMPGAGFGGVLSSIFGVISFSVSGYAGGITICNPTGGFMSNASIGMSLCSVIAHAGAFPAFLTGIAYLIGLVFGFWGVYKIKAHVINPAQTSLSEGVTRLLAGGAFFALPIIVEVARNTMSPIALQASALAPIASGFNPVAGTCGQPGSQGGLDCAMVAMMNDLLAPTHVVLNFFAFCAGMVFIMIGISRLIKSAQEGARGPGGLGTIGTFIAGGALISYNELVRAMTQSLSMGNLLGQTRAFVNMNYTGVSATELAQAQAVVSAVMKFMIIVGLISFVRGIFIIRGVAEGNSQSSLMAGATHVVGGALAVNLGPLIMAVQQTLGLASGITFT